MLVVVSGSKDSMALWDVLAKEGYNVVAMYINLGIGEYSNKSQDVVKNFAKKNNLPLIVKNIKEEFGLDIYKLSKSLKRSPCSVCGTIKRYLFNKVAYDNGFSVIATGHNIVLFQPPSDLYTAARVFAILLNSLSVDFVT
ncbi:tRNA(Ile)-lysidine synthase TilS/MesJ [Thermoanaerobacter pentosaceus]|uniref:tRNA(Ile)-lysidine synthase TilS/MesJ n=1 Tax=Thermoanaerobacter pentosaceus TaxID=694059 RepID=A0ABT9M7T7_9THEO|nr:tRNA(Ile)-lysidine synthase TilS/MesJ [Thermoanaerobacter pentosaceus]